MMKRLLIAALLISSYAFAQNPNTAVWPGANATDANLFVATNNSQSVLNGNVLSTDTSIILTSAATFVTPVIIAIDNEFIHCQTKTGNTLTSCTRGQENSTQAAHTSGAPVYGYITQFHYDQVAAEIKAIEANAYHGSGTNNSLPVRTSATGFGDSSMTQDGTTGQLIATKGFSGPVCAQTFNSTPVYNTANCNRIEMTLTSNVTGSSFSNLKAGQKITVALTQNGTGGFTNVWPTSATNTCPVSPTASSTTTAQLEVQSDAATVVTLSCTYTGTPGGLTGVLQDGTLIASRPIVNFKSGSGITQSCADNPTANSVECTPAADTAVLGTRVNDQNGTSRSIIATSSSAGAAFIAGGSPAFTGYTQNQTLSFIASDHACAAGATLALDGLAPVNIKKVNGGSLVNIVANDCLQNVPILMRAHGSPVDAYIINPDAPVTIGTVNQIAAYGAAGAVVSGLANLYSNGTVISHGAAISSMSPQVLLEEFIDSAQTSPSMSGTKTGVLINAGATPDTLQETVFPRRNALNVMIDVPTGGIVGSVTAISAYARTGSSGIIGLYAAVMPSQAGRDIFAMNSVCTDSNGVGNYTNTFAVHFCVGNEMDVFMNNPGSTQIIDLWLTHNSTGIQPQVDQAATCDIYNGLDIPNPLPWSQCFVANDGGGNGNALYVGSVAKGDSGTVNVATSTVTCQNCTGSSPMSNSFRLEASGQTLYIAGSGAIDATNCPSNLCTITAPLTLTAAANASGGNTVYTGTITGGASNGLSGKYYGVSGFVTSANNGGPWVVAASTTTTLTLANASGVAETHAGVGGGKISDTVLTITGNLGTVTGAAWAMAGDSQSITFHALTGPGALTAQEVLKQSGAYLHIAPGSGTHNWFLGGTQYGSLSSGSAGAASILQLGSPGTITGQLNLPNGNTGGFTVTVRNDNDTTAAYNYNLPATAGTSGWLQASGGGVNNPMTWTPPTGNGTFFVSGTAGTYTLGDGLKIDSGGNVVDSGAAFGVPTGSCGGDLNGTFPNCGVAKINGASVPNTITVLGSNGSGQLVATTTTGTGSSVVLSASPSLTTPSMTTPAITGSVVISPTAGTLTGTATAGTPTCYQPAQGVGLKLAVCKLISYQETSTAQTWTFPTAFSSVPVLVLNSGAAAGSCGTWNPTVTATVLTLPANASMTAENCQVFIVGT